MNTRELALTRLSRANRIRSERAALKRKLHDGHVNLARVLVSPPPWVSSMPVVALLGAAPWAGKVKAERIPREACIPLEAQVGDLSYRARVGVLAIARERYPRMWARWNA